MAKIANVALTNTFDTWRTRSNEAFNRLSQFAINNSSLYANTLTSNVAFTAKGTATVTGLFTASGRATVGTNLTVSGNTTTNKATVTSSLTVSGNTTLGGASKTLTIGGAGATTNATGWFGVNGRASVGTNLFVGGNTTVVGITTLKGFAYIGDGSDDLITITGRVPIVGNMSVSGNTTLGGAGKFANATGWFGVNGRQSISTNLHVSGNTSVLGRLGVGLTNPSALLHSYSSSAVANYLLAQHSSTYNAGVQMTNSQGSWYSYVAGGGNQYEIYGGTSPSVKLSIAGSGLVTVPLNLTVTNTLTAGNTVLTGTTTDRSNALSQTLTDAATINWDTSLGRVATVTLGAAGRTMAAPTNLKVGTYILRVYQDATGSRTITTWNSVFKWTAAVAPVLSTGANKLDIITFFSDGTNLYGSYLPDMR